MRTARARPAVSVVIPVHNRLRFLPETLESVRAQTFSDYEILLVDDASTDGVEKWIARQSMPGLRFFRFRENRGASAARKRALAEARGEFVAFLDSDDLWKPGFLRSMMPEFRDPAVVLAFSNVDLIDEAGRVLRRRATLGGGPVPCTPTMSTTIARRKAIVHVGGFDARFKRLFDDADLFARLVLRYGTGAFRWVDRALARRRIHPVQLTTILKRPPDRRPVGCDESEIQVVLDLIHLGRKHESWLSPMLPEGRRFPAQTLSWGSWSVFEMAFRHMRSGERGRS
jgi:glycosyltransferase involved in cell wall biosynthesis